MGPTATQFAGFCTTQLQVPIVRRVKVFVPENEAGTASDEGSTV
jgi:hypothetical protein